MKKILLFIILTSLNVASCTYDDDIVHEKLISSDIRSFEEALQIAQESLDMMQLSETRGISYKRSIDMDKCKIVGNGNTRSPFDSSDTLMYVFNFNDNQGFAIVAAPKNAEGLLAITEAGCYNPKAPANIDGFDEFVLKAKEYCVEKLHTEAEHNKSDGITRSPVGGTEEYMDSIYYSLYYIALPLVSVRWGQTQPEGEFCPNGISGCSNTAMAQIMSYFQYPDTIYYTYPGADRDFDILNWSGMKSHATRHSLSDCADTISHYSIARLLRQLGFLNFSDYNINGTSTYTESYAGNTFRYLGYHVGDWVSYNATVACNSLDASRPLLMKGRTPNDEGHAWVLDGYKIIRKYVQRMRRINGSNWFPIGSPSGTDKKYMHYNWGWYGNCNGYFLSLIFDTSSAEDYDTASHTASYNFMFNVKMMSVYR